MIPIPPRAPSLAEGRGLPPATRKERQFMLKSHPRKPYHILLILCLVLLFLPQAAFAATKQDTAYADSLYQLGVFYGTDQGYDLDRAPTRAESTAMLVRMLGAEDQSRQLENASIPFSDVPQWALGYAAYAYENGLVAGISDTRFGASLSTTAQMYTVFMLRALGYTESQGDFTYSQAMSFAQSIGLLDEDLAGQLSSSSFTRADAVRLTYEALRFPVKDSSLLLVEKLAGEGKLSQDKVSRFLETIISSQDNRQELRISQIANQRESVVLLEGSVSDGLRQGSGVILSTDGLILTNYHVIEGLQSMAVTFNDGSVYEGEVYVEDYDADLDLALIRIDREELTPVTIGDSDQLSIGDTVVAIGSPYGLQNTVSEGIISSIRDSELQITAAISSGSSGGALFNAYGELVGITYAGVSQGQNLGFAIPINLLDTLDQRLHQSLSEFSQQLAQALAPQNLTLVAKQDNSIYLQWDPVENADYYLLYYRTSSEDAYKVFTNYGFPYRFSHGSDYSAALRVLDESASYQLAVSAVVEGEESPLSQALTVSL